MFYFVWRSQATKLKSRKVLMKYSPGVNFINILCARFLYEILAPKPKRKKKKDVRTKKALKKRWWNWHLDNEDQGDRNPCDQEVDECKDIWCKVTIVWIGKISMGPSWKCSWNKVIRNKSLELWFTTKVLPKSTFYSSGFQPQVLRIWWTKSKWPQHICCVASNTVVLNLF